MLIFGFSLNMLTLLGLILAIGIVVDDAIVMTENIYVRIEKGMPPKEAGIEGAKEIFFAVISTTITLVAVFFPIVFMDGDDGTTVPRIQYRGLRFGDYLLLRRIDFYADACHQTFNQKGTAELVLSQDRTFLRRDEPGIQPVTGRLPETALDCLALHHRHHSAYRSPLEYYPAETGAIGGPFANQYQYNGAEGVTYEYIRDYTEDINHLVDSIIPDAEAVTAR